MLYNISKNDIDHIFIQSIKDMRAVTGWGLRETKDICDNMRSDKSVKIDLELLQVSQLRAYGFTVSPVFIIELDDSIF